MHYTIHNGIRKLRKLLGLVTEQCDRCDSERERRRAIETNGQLADARPFDAELIAGLVPESNISDQTLVARAGVHTPGWTSYRVHRDMSPSPQGLNRQFFTYNTLGRASYSVKLGKQEHFPLPEAAKELYEKPNG